MASSSGSENSGKNRNGCAQNNGTNKSGNSGGSGQSWSEYYGTTTQIFPFDGEQGFKEPKETSTNGK
jgi:hypothetical protein